METGTADNEVVVDIESSVTTHTKKMIFVNYGFIWLFGTTYLKKKFKRPKKVAL